MRILLVDDHTLFLESLQALLTTQGFEIAATASDGFEALEQARRLKPDLILMDIEMPRCDGLAATRLIKAELPEIMIVMLTIAGDDEHLFDAVKSGASGYLLKGLKADKFIELLRQIEQGAAPFSPGLASKVLAEFARLAHGAETAHPPQSGAPAGLSPRQQEILTLVAQGATYQQVADRLFLSERTVRYHMSEILERLHLDNRAQVIRYAIEHGLAPRGKKAS